MKKNQDDFDDLISESDVADLLKIHVETVRYHRRAGRPLVAFISVGPRRVMYRRSDLVEALDMLRVPAYRHERESERRQRLRDVRDGNLPGGRPTHRDRVVTKGA